MYIAAALIFLNASCQKPNKGGDDSRVVLNGPVPYSGDVPPGPDPAPSPQSPSVYAPYAGVWENSSLKLILLSDGRAATLNSNTGAEPAEIGTYQITNGRVYFRWIFSDPEDFPITVDGSSLSLLQIDLDRTGNSDAAPSAYNQVYSNLTSQSQQLAARFPFGSISSSTSDANDPNPNNVVKNGKVFAGSDVTFLVSFSGTEWFNYPNDIFNRVGSYWKYSYAYIKLLKNGRFIYEQYLDQGIDVNGNKILKHNLSWGKYNIVPGTDAVSGDIINFYYDNGGTAAYKTAGGEKALYTKNTIFHNVATK
jgi:hypothetical protein